MKRRISPRVLSRILFLIRDWPKRKFFFFLNPDLNLNLKFHSTPRETVLDIAYQQERNMYLRMSKWAYFFSPTKSPWVKKLISVLIRFIKLVTRTSIHHDLFQINKFDSNLLFNIVNYVIETWVLVQD